MASNSKEDVDRKRDNHVRPSTKLQMKRGKRRWRRGNQERREPQIDHEALSDAKIKKYRERTEIECRRHREDWKEDSTNWDMMTEILISARKTCGSKQRRIENPWLQGRSGEIEVLDEDVRRKLERQR